MFDLARVRRPQSPIDGMDGEDYPRLVRWAGPATGNVRAVGAAEPARATGTGTFGVPLGTGGMRVETVEAVPVSVPAETAYETSLSVDSETAVGTYDHVIVRVEIGRAHV